MNIIKTIILAGTLLLLSCGSASLLTPQPAKPTALPPAAKPTAAAPVITLPPAPTTTESDGGVSMGDSVTMPKAEPQLGKITFALGATADYQPINPGMLFTKGITQIHAVFTYTNLSPTDNWERVWYVNDREVSRSSALWTGPTSGTFDYFINNSDRPLPAGDWLLQLYVNGKLRALGVFIIENAATP